MFQHMIWCMLMVICFSGCVFGAVDIDDQGSILVNGETWLKTGSPYATVNGILYTIDGASKLIKVGEPIETKGSDKFGTFTRLEQHWTAGGTNLTTAVNKYPSLVVYEQFWPQGATGTATSRDGSKLVSAWPVLTPAATTKPSLGFVSFTGRFLEASRAGKWQNNPDIGTGVSGDSSVTDWC